MAYTNYEGERELTTIQSYNYGEKVIEFLQLRNYYLVRDSNIDGIFQDKIFRRPKFDGNRETVVEIKNTSIGVSDVEFLKEFGDYFRLYMRQKPENRSFFKVFAIKTKNPARWKKIFDEIKSTQEEIQNFFTRVKEKTTEDFVQEMSDYSLDDFQKFIMKTEIAQISYQKLLQEIDLIKRNKQFDFSAEYLEENTNLIYESDELVSNIIRVNKFPETIFSGQFERNTLINKFWDRPDADQFVVFSNMLFSLKPFSESLQHEFLIINALREIRFEEIPVSETELEDIKKMIIRAFIISKSSIVGYWYNRRLKCLYIPHFNLNNKFHKVKGKSGHKTRVVSKVYKYDGKINFVAHRGLKFNVTQIDNTFYIVFNFFRLFTRDGKRVIEGDEAKQLHYTFPPTKAFNNIERSKLDFLITLIDLKHIDWDHPSYINTSKPIKIEVPCKSIKGYIFDDIEPKEEYINPFEEWEDEF